MVIPGVWHGCGKTGISIPSQGRNTGVYRATWGGGKGTTVASLMTSANVYFYLSPIEHSHLFPRRQEQDVDCSAVCKMKDRKLCKCPSTGEQLHK